MANENIGNITCSHHREPLQAFVRKDKRDKLYIYCPKCGIIAPKAHTFQDFIKENATMYGAPNTDYKGGGEPIKPSENPEATEKQEEAKPERQAENFTPAPEAITKKQPRKISAVVGGFLGMLGSEE